jgi:hypothetical protein
MQALDQRSASLNISGIIIWNKSKLEELLALVLPNFLTLWCLPYQNIHPFVTRPTLTEHGTKYQNIAKVPSDVPVGDDSSVGSLIPITTPITSIKTVMDFQAANK